MGYTLIDGKATSKAIEEELAEAVKKQVDAGGKVPHLAAVLVGNDGASQTYVGGKVRACERVGFKSTLVEREETITEAELLAVVDELNRDEDIDGFIVQLPLPKHINSQKIIEAIDPKKDVDGFHPQNVGKMVLGLPGFLPATPAGILELLKRYNIPTSGKHCVVVGRSQIVGTPMSLLLSRNDYPGNCTVTIVHSRTADLSAITKQADILIAAVGKPGMIDATMVKDGVVIIDVGTTRVPDSTRKRGFRLSGDVKFDEVSAKASFITPVPGGVGPMTIASLLRNCWQAAAGK